MAGRFLALTTLLFMLTACGQEKLSLPVAHAAGSQPRPAGEIAPSPNFSFATPESDSGVRPRISEETYEPASSESCYVYILLRPKEQRAAAVQARLKEADRMAAALDSRTFAVDLVGDHANILSLQFPVVWPAKPSYSAQIGSIVEDYFSSPEVQDDMCNSGFAEVRLSAWGLNDRRIHLIWKARITSEGLLKVTADGQQLAVADSVSLP
jgi:hypothetical protein